MSVRPLKSDQVNYLIWRYLQESGHAQTAARLQLDWGRTDPQRLPFAQHIRTHALVHLLQKGLRYHELETSIDQNGHSKPPSFFFGSEVESASPVETGNIDDDASNTSRKHQRDSISNETDFNANAPSAKRSRRAAGGPVNGSNHGRPDGEGMELDPAGSADLTAAKREPGPGPSATSPASTAANNAALPPNSEMDLDSTSKPTGDSNQASGAIDPSQNLYRSEAATHAKPKQEGESGDGGDADLFRDAAAGGEPPTISIVPTLVNGSSVGVQSEKVTELGPETGVLAVPGKNVTHALWSPRNPGMLAAAGDALCRLWSMPTTTGANPPSDSANGFTKPREPRSIEPTTTVDLNPNRDAYYVSSIAWNEDGSMLAVAKHPYAPHRNTIIELYDGNGTDVVEFEGTEDIVINLIWNPQSTLILGICNPGDDTSRIKVWEVGTSTMLDLGAVSHTIWDASWIDEKQFYICAHNYIAKAEVQQSTVIFVNERVGEQLTGNWSKIVHDRHTNSTALGADGNPATLGLFAGSGWAGTKEAHAGVISSLSFQPLTSSAAAAVRSQHNAIRILASSSDDGTIKLWNAARQLELLHELDMGKSYPVQAMAFTPDGYLVAGASADKILVWNTETGGSPKASWYGRDAGWLTNGEAHVNGNGHSAENGDVDMADSEDDDPIPTLGWDADGKKLVCAVRNQLAIISMRR